MEKPTINFSVSRMLSSLRGIVGRTMNADTLWQVIIGSVLCALVATCIFAYFTYVWAVNTEVAQVVTKKDHSTFSLSDIKKVIVQYQTKEERYNELLRTHPIAPPYMKGRGVVVASPSGVLKDTVVEATGTLPLSPTLDKALTPR
jgi:hypothetical protein